MAVQVDGKAGKPGVPIVPRGELVNVHAKKSDETIVCIHIGQHRQLMQMSIWLGL